MQIPSYRRPAQSGRAGQPAQLRVLHGPQPVVDVTPVERTQRDPRTAQDLLN